MKSMQETRSEAAVAANADDAKVWRWISSLIDEGRIRWVCTDGSWRVSVDHRRLATESSFDLAIRTAMGQCGTGGAGSKPLTSNRGDRSFHSLALPVRVGDSKPIASPSEVTTGILGLGALGTAASARVAPAGFKVAGSSRSKKVLPDADTVSNDDGCEHGFRHGSGHFQIDQAHDWGPIS